MSPQQVTAESAYRAEYGRVLATLIRQLGDFDRAEDALQEAFLVAIARWPVDGIPDQPAAWLTTVARRKALDQLRSESIAHNKQAELARLQSATETSEATEEARDPLRLLFTCCHPALPQEVQIALTLRTIAGLQTEEIAAAFLVPTATMAQRIVRAKRKIQVAGIPYRIPEPEEWPVRISSVLRVLYLIFNEGYFSAKEADTIRLGLCDAAIEMTRQLVHLVPHDSSISGLLALMLLHHARRECRGSTLEDQDRTRWDQPLIVEGIALTKAALQMPRLSTYAIQAAIAAIHAEAESFQTTDWRQIAALYTELSRRSPSPIIELNRAIAISMVDGPTVGLALLDKLEREPELHQYQPFHAGRADLLRRAGRFDEAAKAYQLALQGVHSKTTKELLQRRLDEITNK